MVVVAASLACVAGLPAQDEPASEPAAAQEGPASDFGKLPWADQQGKVGGLPARRLASPQEMLDLYSIDASQLSTFTDGEPLGEQDDEVIVRLLYQMPRLPLNDIQRWAKPATSLPSLDDSPRQRHGDVIRLEGLAKSYQRVELLSEVAERTEFDHYFRVEVELANEFGLATICTRSIPAAWQGSAIVDELVSAYAFLLKVTNEEGGSPSFAFAVPRIAWHPTRPDTARRISEDVAYLGTLGMDAGLFDDVRSTNKKPMSQIDRECFYQLLATVGSAKRDDLRSRSDPALDLAALLEEPAQQHGRLMVVRGTARRILTVRIDDDDIRERFGIDQYYQMDVFIPLQNQKVRIGKEADGKGREFINSYPVTICVLDLPNDLPPTPDMREEVAVPASFFKLWAYRSQFVSSVNRKHLQVSPMFIGATPSRVDRTRKTNPYVSFAVAGGFVVLIGGLWFVLWRSSRADSRFTRTILKREHELKPGQSLDKLTARDEPDFSNLD